MDEELLHLPRMIEVKLHQAENVEMGLAPWVHAARLPQVDLVLPYDHRFVTVPAQDKVRLLFKDEPSDLRASYVIR